MYIILVSECDDTCVHVTILVEKDPIETEVRYILLLNY